MLAGFLAGLAVCLLVLGLGVIMLAGFEFRCH